MDDFRKIIYGVLAGFVLLMVGWISFLTLSGCGFSLNNCNAAAPGVDRTPIPTLVPATLPALDRLLGPATFTSVPSNVAGSSTPAPTEAGSNIPRPSNPGGPGPAVGLTGNIEAGKEIFAANCAICHSDEGKGGKPNPGSSDGTIPPLNPIDPNLKDPDYKTFATNLDLFVEHGSTPEGVNPTFSMLPWGDKGLLTPQQIADVIAYVIDLNR
jgi:mono/diheme cytochrome c family protein